MLKRRGIKHEVLNAKFHEKESGIVAQAGRTGAVTIATNMAGRGTDILLGGNPAGLASEIAPQARPQPGRGRQGDATTRRSPRPRPITEEDHDRVVAAGGLHIIGTERHDSRRIDNQLRGRAGRQGDPGSSRFYLSLEDDLMKRFASERVTGLMERLGLDEDVAIESRLVSRTIESAQSRVEGFNFDIRKRVVEYDDVINKQRETIYAERDKVLHNEDLTETVQSFLDEEVDALVDTFLVGEDPTEWNLEGLSSALAAMGLTGEGTSADDAVGARQPRGDRRAPPRAGRRAAGGQGGRGRRGGLEDRRAAGPDPDHRLAVGRAPDRARRHAARHRPARLRPAGPAQRVQARGLRLYDELREPDPPRRRPSIFRVTVTRQPAPTEGGDPAVAASLARGAASLSAGNGASGGNGRAIGTAGTAGAAGGRRRGCEGPGSGCGRRLGHPARRSAGSADDPPDARLARRPADHRRRWRRGRRPGRPEARVHSKRRADRPQRPVLVRFRREVQEVPRALSPAPRRSPDQPRDAPFAAP